MNDDDDLTRFLTERLPQGLVGATEQVETGDEDHSPLEDAVVAWMGVLNRGSGGKLLVSEEGARRVVSQLVRVTTRMFPNDATAMEQTLMAFYEEWAARNVATELGGGGGTIVWAEQGSLLVCRSRDPEDPQDARLEWQEGRWVVLEEYEHDYDDDGSVILHSIPPAPHTNAPPHPLIELFLEGIFFAEDDDMDGS